MSFTRKGLVMFTVREGAEYVVALGHYTTGNPSDNAVYRVQAMNTALSLCSYSRDRYVTADNYSNTAYIQYVKQNRHFTDIDAGEYMYNRKVLAVSDSGAYAAISTSYFPNGTYDGNTDSITNHLFIYEISDGRLSEVTTMSGYDINSAAFIGKDTLVVNANKDGNFNGEETLIVDAVSLQAQTVSEAPKSNRTNMKFTESDDGVYYFADSERNLVYMTADGKYVEWGNTEADSVGTGREVINSTFAPMGAKAVIYAQLKEEDKKALVVFDFDSGSEKLLDFDFSADERLEVQRIFRQDENTVGVFFNNRTVSLFDIGTGKELNTISLDGTSQEPVSAVPLGDGSFAVLCRDSSIYEMTADGFTGRSCRLDFADDFDNDIRESDSSAAAKLEIKPSADNMSALVVWDGSEAWLLDKSRFTVRYRVDGFAGAPAENNIVFIADGDRNKIGCFPIYSTQQLLDAANEYLTALGERTDK